MSYIAFEIIKDELIQYDLKSVANAAGVSYSCVVKWANGKTKAPRISSLSKVASVLGYQIEVIVK